MKRTVLHTAKQFIIDPFNQSQTLFPFLNSASLDSHAHKIIKFQNMHALANMGNLKEVLPLPSECKEFVFLGRSNVGKSSLLNNLMQASIAAVSKRPGKTKELMFCQVGSNNPVDKRIIKESIFFVDAPGYGFATGVSKGEIKQWGKLITSYLKMTSGNSLNQRFLLLIDITHGLKETDALVFEMLSTLKKQFTIIFTKCDKFEFSPNNEDLKRGIEIAELIQDKYKLMNLYVHFTSSRTRMGIDELRNHIMFEMLGEKL